MLRAPVSALVVLKTNSALVNAPTSILILGTAGDVSTTYGFIVVLEPSSSLISCSVRWAALALGAPAHALLAKLIAAAMSAPPWRITTQIVGVVATWYVSLHLQSLFCLSHVLQCTGGSTCVGRSCQCPANQKRCGLACMLVDRDPWNCGDCDNRVGFLPSLSPTYLI